MNFQRTIKRNKHKLGVQAVLMKHEQQLSIIDKYLESLEALLIEKQILTREQLDSIADAAVNGYSVGQNTSPAPEKDSPVASNTDSGL